MSAMTAGGVRAVTPNGVLGDARGASAEEGIALLAQATSQLISFVVSWPPYPDDLHGFRVPTACPGEEGEDHRGSGVA